MSGEMKNIVKHGSIYTIGILLSRMVSFLMIPIYTNYLSPTEYGTLELLSLTIEFLSTATGIGMGAAVLRFYFRYDDADSRRQVVSSAMIGSMTLMGLTSATCMFFSWDIAELVFSSRDYASYFHIMFITMFLNTGINLPLIYLRARMRSRAFVIVSLVKLILQLSLNIVFLVVLKMGVVGILYSGLIASAIIGGYLMFTTFRDVKVRFNFQIYKEMLKFGMPLIVSNLSAFMMTYADRYFLKYFCDLNEVGVYSLAYRFGMVVSMLCSNPFQSIWGARLFEIAERKDGPEFFGKVLDYFLMYSLTVSLALSILSRDVLRVMSEQSYWEAYKVVPLISLSYVLFGLSPIIGSGILIKNKTKYKAISTGTGMVANLVFNFFLIPVWAGMGAGIATILAYIVRQGIDTYYSQKLYPIVFHAKKLIQMAGIYLILVVVALNINLTSAPLSITLNIFLVAAFPLSLYVFNVLAPDDKKYVTAFLRNPSATLKKLRG